MLRPERPPGRIGWLAGGALALSLLTIVSRVSRLVPALSRSMPRPIPTEFSEDEASGRGRPGTSPSLGARSAGHETDDMQGGLMGRLVLLLGVVALCMIFAMVGLRSWVISTHIADQPRLTAQQVETVSPPEPHLQKDPMADLARLRDGQDGKLDGYGFVDAAHNRARIPIDRAMALSVGHGLEPPP